MYIIAKPLLSTYINNVTIDMMTKCRLEDKLLSDVLRNHVCISENILVGYPKYKNMLYYTESSKINLNNYILITNIHSKSILYSLMKHNI